MRIPARAGTMQLDHAIMVIQPVTTGAFQPERWQFHEAMGREQIATRHDITTPEEHLLKQRCFEVA